MIGEVVAFYGLGWQDVLDMDVRWFCKLYRRVPVIEARRLLPRLQAYAFPHLTEEGRAHVHQALMELSGYGKMRDDALAHEEYEAGWGMLRGLGMPAQVFSELKKEP